MKKSLFTKILTVVGAAVLTLPAVLGVGSNTVKAADNDTQNIILTKYGFDTKPEETDRQTDIQWDGNGAKALEGVEFEIYDATAEYWSNPSEFAKLSEKAKRDGATKITEGAPFVTDKNGRIKFSSLPTTVKVDGTSRSAVYLFHEINQRAGYGTASDFWLTLPAKADQNGNVYVYPKNTKVDTYQRHFHKIDGATGEALAGAEFAITNGTVGTDGKPSAETKYLKLTDKDGNDVAPSFIGFVDVLAKNYRMTWVSNVDEATKFVSDSQGNFGLNGFTDNIRRGYVETKAPEGYETVSGTFVPTKDDDTSTPLIIKDTPKGLLPHTGGKGIVAFVVAGVALIALGGLAYSKRRAA